MKPGTDILRFATLLSETIFGFLLPMNFKWNVWQEHPDCETIRSMGCPIYKQLCTIFEEPGTKEKLNGSDCCYMETPQAPGEQHLNTCQEDSSISESDTTADDPKNSQCTTASSNVCRKRGRRGIDDSIAKAILEMATDSKLRANAIRKYNERFTITDCVRALDELQGVDESLYYAALDLFDNRSAREIFLSLKVDKRLTWLTGKCLVTLDSNSQNVHNN